MRHRNAGERRRRDRAGDARHHVERTPAAPQRERLLAASSETNGSPPFRRTTRRPRRAARIISALIRSCVSAWRPARLPTKNRCACRAYRRIRSSMSASYRTRSAARSHAIALRVSSAGSPGPAPTSETRPAQGEGSGLSLSRPRAGSPSALCPQPCALRSPLPFVQPFIASSSSGRAFVHRHAVAPSSDAAGRALRAATARVRGAAAARRAPARNSAVSAGRLAVRRNGQREALAPNDTAEIRRRIRRIVHRVDEEPPLLRGLRDRAVHSGVAAATTSHAPSRSAGANSRRDDRAPGARRRRRLVDCRRHLRRHHADRRPGRQQLLQLGRRDGSAADEHDAAAGEVQEKGQQHKKRPGKR